MFKKVTLALSIAAIAVAVLGSGAVFAAGDDLSYRGPNGTTPDAAPGQEPGLGLMEDYMIEYVVDQFDITAAEVQAKLDEGIELSQILIELGVVDVWSVTNAAHAYAVEQLDADGIAFPGWKNNRQGGSFQGGGTRMGGGMGRYNQVDQ